MPSKPAKLTSKEAFEREYLPTRSKLLELAAALDRIDRTEMSQEDLDDCQPRRDLIEQALRLLAETKLENRAEKIQHLFSREYDSSWYQAWVAETTVAEGKS